MDKVLMWSDELDEYKSRLRRATQATQCLLARRSLSDGDTLPASRNGDHSEGRLLETEVWKGARFMEGGKRDRGTVTTHGGMQAAHEAGWRHCVIDFGKGMTRRGSELLEYLQANC